METPTLLGGVTVILMIGTLSISIPASQIYLDRLSYEILRGVNLTWFYYWWLSRLLLACLDWFEGLEFPALCLVERLVTKTCWVAARTSSLSMEYLFTRLNRLSIVAGGFFVTESKNDVPGQMFHLKIYKMASMLQDSTWSTTCLNRLMKSLSDSFSCILMFCRVLMFCLWRVEHK